MILSDTDGKKLEEVQGYIALGMFKDAESTLASISTKSDENPEVLKVRFELHLKAKQWERLYQIAEQLSLVEPENPEWFLRLANLARKFDGIKGAHKILVVARNWHPNNLSIQKHLTDCETMLTFLDASVSFS